MKKKSIKKISPNTPCLICGKTTGKLVEYKNSYDHQSCITRIES